MAFAAFGTHDFPGPSDAKALGSRLMGFQLELWHVSSISLQDSTARIRAVRDFDLLTHCPDQDLDCGGGVCV